MFSIISDWKKSEKSVGSYLTISVAYNNFRKLGNSEAITENGCYMEGSFGDCKKVMKRSCDKAGVR